MFATAGASPGRALECCWVTGTISAHGSEQDNLLQSNEENPIN